MNVSQERTGNSGITPLDIEWSVRPGIFEKMRDRGYVRVVSGGGDWVCEPHKIPFLVGVSGGQAYRIVAMWAFFHPDGQITVSEKPKTRIRYPNHDQQNTPLAPRERSFGTRRGYESYLEAYNIQVGEPFDLREFMDSEVYQEVLRRWRLTGHMRIHRLEHLFGRFGPKILGEELPPPSAGMPVDSRSDLELKRAGKSYNPEERVYVRFARVIGPGQLVIGESYDDIRCEYVKELQDWDIDRKSVV